MFINLIITVSKRPAFSALLKTFEVALIIIKTTDEKHTLECHHHLSSIVFDIHETQLHLDKKYAKKMVSQIKCKLFIQEFLVTNKVLI